jgi:hypothetical protein
MNATKRNFNSKTKKNNSKTKKNKINALKMPKPSLNVLKVGYPLFGAKSIGGDKLLEYTKEQEMKSHDSCLLLNSSWFGDYIIAKSYKTSSNKIYRWKIKVKTNLVITNEKNEKFFESLFTNTTTKLVPTIIFTKEQMEKIKYTHPYLQMSDNEKAFFEFKFAFGYITLEEQYNFLKLIEYLLKNKIIVMETRDKTSILTKLSQKILYYKTNIFFKRKPKYNRLSFYYFDKYAVMNLCKSLHDKKINISGIYQKNDTSFWFPDFVVYKMNIKEYILFNPQHNLVYDKEVE